MAWPRLETSLIFQDDVLRGLSVIAEPQTEAEMFCVSFPRKLLGKIPGDAEIAVRDGTLVLIDDHEEVGWFSLLEQHRALVDDFLNSNGRYAGASHSLCHDGLLTPGFKIVLAGTEKGEAGTYCKLNPVRP